MKILLLFAALATAGCFPDPEPGCPEVCEEVHGLEGYLEGCFCPPKPLADICEDDIADEKEIWEKELAERCEELE